MLPAARNARPPHPVYLRTPRGEDTTAHTPNRGHREIGKRGGPRLCDGTAHTYICIDLVRFLAGGFSL